MLWHHCHTRKKWIARYFRGFMIQVNPQAIFESVWWSPLAVTPMVNTKDPAASWWILRRLDGNISPLCMERIYKTAIRSRMEYACAVWSGGSTRSLQRLQDSFAKRLGLTLPPLKNRFNYHTLVLFYKIRQNLAPKYLCSLVPDLSSTTSGYSFRKFSYPVPLTKKSATLESFLPRAIILWNDLPTNVQSDIKHVQDQA